MSIKNELQNIISGNGAVGNGKIIQTITNHLRAKKKAIPGPEEAKFDKEQETKALVEFIESQGLWYYHINDYYHPHLGIIIEDLHDENVLTEEGSLQFIDTVFFLTPAFFEKD